MKVLFNISLIVFTLFFITCNSEQKSAQEAPLFIDGIYKINKLESSVEWTASKENNNVSGTVDLNDGEFKVLDGNIKSGKFVIDMYSIDAAEENAKDRNDLNNELKSEEFFNVNRYAIALFDIDKIEAKKEENTTHLVSGKLTIMGVTNDILFPANFSADSTKISANAVFKIDRTKWNVNHNSSTAEKDTPAEKVIKDEIEFKINILTKILSDEIDFTQMD